MPSLIRAACLFPLFLLAACEDRNAVAAKPPVLVRTEVVRLQPRLTVVSLIGDIQARVSTELSFRVSGRVTERLVDVGAHVRAGEVLAKIDPTEQQADLAGAMASVSSAESQLRVATATFERQKTLLASGFTTRVAFEQAQEGLRTAEGSLEAAKAQLGTAQDALTYTVLRAGADGVITARNIEVGQVAQAAQSAFTLARDGPRDAVFDVYESVFLHRPESNAVTLTLVSDSSVSVVGQVREVSPTIDPATATVRVKVAIENTPPAMTLGSSVIGAARISSAQRIILPSSVLTTSGGLPAVWVVDPETKEVSLKPVAIDSYEVVSVVLKTGVQVGDRVVVDGSKMLRPGQAVTFPNEGA